MVIIGTSLLYRSAICMMFFLLLFSFRLQPYRFDPVYFIILRSYYRSSLLFLFIRSLSIESGSLSYSWQ